MAKIHHDQSRLHQHSQGKSLQGVQESNGEINDDDERMRERKYNVRKIGKNRSRKPSVEQFWKVPNLVIIAGGSRYL